LLLAAEAEVELVELLLEAAVALAVLNTMQLLRLLLEFLTQ
jgi:hypothetical protein